MPPKMPPPSNISASATSVVDAKKEKQEQNASLKNENQSIAASEDTTVIFKANVRDILKEYCKLHFDAIEEVDICHAEAVRITFSTGESAKIALAKGFLKFSLIHKSPLVIIVCSSPCSLLRRALNSSPFLRQISVHDVSLNYFSVIFGDNLKASEILMKSSLLVYGVVVTPKCAWSQELFESMQKDEMTPKYRMLQDQKENVEKTTVLFKADVTAVLKGFFGKIYEGIVSVKISHKITCVEFSSEKFRDDAIQKGAIQYNATLLKMTEGHTFAPKKDNKDSNVVAVFVCLLTELLKLVLSSVLEIEKVHRAANNCFSLRFEDEMDARQALAKNEGFVAHGVAITPVGVFNKRVFADLCHAGTPKPTSLNKKQKI